MAAHNLPIALPPLLQVLPNGHLLGPGDKLRLIVNDAPEMSMEYSISSGGTLAMLLIGQIRAGGKTPDQLAKVIHAALISRDMFRDPSVAVEVTAYRPIFVLGGFQHPGQFAYQLGMAVLPAGGFIYRAAKTEFSVIRAASAEAAVEACADRNSLPRPGDVLTVFDCRF